MNSSIACLLLILAATAGPAADPSPVAQPSPSALLRTGMSPAEVRLLLGPPQRIARQILYHRYLEQWIYNSPEVLRVGFDYPRGQPPRLISVERPADRPR